MMKSVRNATVVAIKTRRTSGRFGGAGFLDAPLTRDFAGAPDMTCGLYSKCIKNSVAGCLYGRFDFASPCHPLQAIDCEQNEERRQKQNHANGGGLRGPEVVELGDNLQRRDLRLAGNISGDEDHR